MRGQHCIISCEHICTVGSTCEFSLCVLLWGKRSLTSFHAVIIIYRFRLLNVLIKISSKRGKHTAITYIAGYNAQVVISFYYAKLLFMILYLRFEHIMADRLGERFGITKLTIVIFFTLFKVQKVQINCFALFNLSFSVYTTQHNASMSRSTL